jgi:hypothetical protein
MAFLLVNQSDVIANLVFVFCCAAREGFAEISLPMIRAELSASVEKTGDRLS